MLLVVPEPTMDPKTCGRAERRDAVFPGKPRGTAASAMSGRFSSWDAASLRPLSAEPSSKCFSLARVPHSGVLRLPGETATESLPRRTLMTGSSARTGMVPATVAYTSNTARHLRARSTAPAVKRFDENRAIRMEKGDRRRFKAQGPDVIHFS